jgi:hypothetical protein
MNSKYPNLLLAAGVALTLGACASLANTHLTTESTLERIHAGLTEDEVTQIAGSPQNKTGASRNGRSMWIYAFTDNWGSPSEFDVSFDAGGHVTSTFVDRNGY